MEPVVVPRTFSGRYEVTHLIARGGMAQVYRARDIRLGRFVALKVLFPELSVDRTFVERFRREAQAAANLSHPNIVAVYDWGEDEGTYFIVMELIMPSSLAIAIREEHTLPATRAATIAAQVASALAYAHRNGVVHRDIKPGNVLLDEDGQVKVTDFGIAQAVSTEEGLTMAGSVMGTAAYFSPEQAEGAVVDGRSDLYSLGIVLFEMLAGRPPYVGDSPVAVASMHVRNEPPLLRDLNPAVPEAIEQVVMKALAKSPDDRYQTAEEFRADLLRFIDGTPVLAGAVGAAAVAATGVVGAAATTGVLPQRDTTMAVPAVAAVAAVDDAEVMPGAGAGEDAKKTATPQRTALIVALAVVLALVGFLVYRGLTGASSVNVQDVSGQPFASATSTLQGQGLKVSSKLTYVANALPYGDVVSTDPPANTAVKPGSTVALTLSKGPQIPVDVPPVVGESVQTATNTLMAKKIGYKVVQVNSWSSPAFANTVLQQQPPAGTTVLQGYVVTLTELSSTGTFPLPNVAGESPGTAGATLGQYGLSVGSSSTACSTAVVASGNVISTSPPSGSTVSAGTVVNLVVSTGACPVQVPNVIGLTQAQATSALASHQLGSSFVNPCTGGQTSTGLVASQSVPYPGTAPPGTVITATFGCSGSTTTTTAPPTSTTG